jgi:hypothetical protein
LITSSADGAQGHFYGGMYPSRGGGPEGFNPTQIFFLEKEATPQPLHRRNMDSGVIEMHQPSLILDCFLLFALEFGFNL